MLMRTMSQPNYFINWCYKIADGLFIVFALLLGGVAIANFYSVTNNLREQTSIPKRYNDDKKAKAQKINISKPEPLSY